GKSKRRRRQSTKLIKLLTTRGAISRAREPDVSTRARLAIQARFCRLLERLDFSSTDLRRFQAHRESLTRRLRISFSTDRVIPIGSSTRGSAIPQSSDLDLMLLLRVQE